jgi:Family of unknown function (DUF6011)
MGDWEVPMSGGCSGRRFKKLDTGTLAVDLLVNRLGHEELSRKTSHRPVEFGITLNPDGERISRRSLRYGDEGRERLVEVILAFLDDPTASLARSKDRCCLCRRKLSDGTSVLRGYGPECAKKIGTLLSYFTGESDGKRSGKVPILDFDSLFSLPVEPHEEHEDDEFGSGLDEDDESNLVPSNKHSGRVDAKLECHDPESEVEKTDPLDDYFDPEAGIWWVESHRGQVCIGLPWTAEAPLNLNQA